MTARLIWATPDTDAVIADIARVSNPSNQGNTETAPRLIRYLIRHKHWSPLEMASMCVEVTTTRDIGRQMIRHYSLRPQEFSQRYADVRALGDPILRRARRQDTKNRQNSIDDFDQKIVAWFYQEQQAHWNEAVRRYNNALERGIAKELARVFLPEGNTPTRMYLAGTIRHWLHYCQLRTGNGTQSEHVEIAKAVWDVLREVAPATVAAAEAE